MTVIDLGGGATDRASSAAGPATLIDLNNTANDTGTIDTFEIWANTNLTACQAATAYLVSGNSWTSRDYQSVGNITSGSKQTFTGLSIDVTLGDAICFEWSGTGAMERDVSGSGVKYFSQVSIPFTNKDFGATIAARTYSVYETGATLGWAGEFCGVAVAEFDGVVPAEIDGV